MARQVIAVALVFVAIVGFASAQQANPPQASDHDDADVPAANAPQAKASAAAPSGSPSDAPAPAPADGPTAKSKEIPEVAMPGPVGSIQKNTDAPSNSGSTVFPTSAIVAGVAVAGFFY